MKKNHMNLKNQPSLSKQLKSRIYDYSLGIQFFHRFTVTQSIEILIESNSWLGMYVPLLSTPPWYQVPDT